MRKGEFVKKIDFFEFFTKLYRMVVQRHHNFAISKHEV